MATWGGRKEGAIQNTVAWVFLEGFALYGHHVNARKDRRKIFKEQHEKPAAGLKSKEIQLPSVSIPSMDKCVSDFFVVVLIRPHVGSILSNQLMRPEAQQISYTSTYGIDVNI